MKNFAFCMAVIGCLVGLTLAVDNVPNILSKNSNVKTGTSWDLNCKWTLDNGSTIDLSYVGAQT